MLLFDIGVVGAEQRLRISSNSLENGKWKCRCRSASEQWLKMEFVPGLESLRQPKVYVVWSLPLCVYVVVVVAVVAVVAV